MLDRKCSVIKISGLDQIVEKTKLPNPYNPNPTQVNHFIWFQVIFTNLFSINSNVGAKFIYSSMESVFERFVY